MGLEGNRHQVLIKVILVQCNPENVENTAQSLENSKTSIYILFYSSDVIWAQGTYKFIWCP